MSFKAITIVVTGGAQGIGLATSEAFASQGAEVILLDCDLQAGTIAENKFLSKGYSARFFQVDVGQPDSIDQFFATKAINKVDVLINNAGIGAPGTLLTRSLEDWNRVISVNLTGPYWMTRSAVPLMPHGSSIINIASTRALMSEADTEPYSASKGGLVALTHSLAVSLSSHQIRVNCISPGWIDTTGWKKDPPTQNYSLSDMDHRQHPVGRVGKPEDIAEACLFLADPIRSGFLTGQNLVIDGGMTIKMIYV